MSPSQLSAGLLTFGVFVTQCCFSHVTEAQGAFAAAIDEQVTVVGVKLSRCDHLCQILHVGWLYVHNVWEKIIAQEKKTKSQHLRACSLFKPELFSLVESTVVHVQIHSFIRFMY